MVQRDGKFVSFTPTAAPPPVEEPEEAPVQFTLRTLLVLQLVCAIFFGLLLMIGAFALPILFIGAVIFAAIRVRPENVPLKRMVVDLLFGVVVPVTCLVIDPWLLEGPVVRPWAGGQRLVSGPLHQFLFAAIGVQMLLFPVWRLGGRWMHRRLVALLAGALWFGTALAGQVALGAFAVFLVLGLLFGRGAIAGYLLALLPLFTAVVFARNAIAATRRARTVKGGILLVLLGAAIAFAIPFFCPELGLAISHALHAIPWPKPLLKG